jgi:hypothetical protein
VLRNGIRLALRGRRLICFDLVGWMLVIARSEIIEKGDNVPFPRQTKMRRYGSMER